MKDNTLKIPTFWFDKDGVLAQYDYSIYEPELGAPAPWLVRNAHVYKNIEPYANICEAFRQLYKETVDLSINERPFNMKVLTLVSDGVTLSEHVLDSAEWCTKNLGLRMKDFFACAVSKENIPVRLRAEINQYDILLDDYMPNLIKWREAGGTAVKIINGINSTTTDFPYFYNSPEPGYLIKLLRQLANHIASGQRLSDGQFAPRMEG